MKNNPASFPSRIPFLLSLFWLSLLFLAYAPFLLHPGLHTACPENDTWNLPVRWSVLSSLRMGKLPLWNPLSAFGIPWLATWQTETFYPGTLLFTWLGLSAWNLSGLLHLLILSLGLYCFLRRGNVQPAWAFFGAAVALLDGCAYNHLGSNSSTDTLAWMPWMLLAVRNLLEGKPFGKVQLAAFFTLQVLAGYPQTILYTLAGCAAYALFKRGPAALPRLLPPLGAGLLLSAAQWVPSAEYFFMTAVRLPAVRENPHFFLPLENLKTFLGFNSLSRDGVPDYVVSPTFFYFNFYAGLLPPALLLWGLVRFRRLGKESRFFLLGFLAALLWSLGLFLEPLVRLSIPFPAFLEPAKAWVLVNLFELCALGFLLEDLFPKSATWKWKGAILAAGILNLLVPLWNHPLEKNLTPPDPRLRAEAQKLRDSLGSGRILVLPDAAEHRALYTPLPDPAHRPLFKHFIPNSNLYSFLPLANFYGSTWPTWGAWDANLYFQYAFPYGQGRLMDLLGVDLLLLTSDRMPKPYQKVWNEGAWALWRNPRSLGASFLFQGTPQTADRKAAFTAFASGKADPSRDLFWDPRPVSNAPASPTPPRDRETFRTRGSGYLVVTQNAVPGWRAWVDGKPQPLYLADGIFQAVALPPGTREVDLAYEPASFRFGLFLSLAALAMGLGFAGFRRG